VPTLVSRPPKPRLTCRVGVTGHRPKRLALSNADWDRIREQAALVLQEVARTVAQLRDSDSRPSPYSDAAPVMRLISPLAEGADRIVAEAALRLNNPPYELQCIFPFPVAVYRTDFTERTEHEDGDGERSGKDFDELRRHATATLELDTEPGTDSSYVPLGHALVRQCDVLLAVWDEDPSKPGGTGEVMLEALRANIPVICIHARHTKDNAISLVDWQKGTIVLGEWSQTALTAKLRTVFTLAPRNDPHEHDAIAPEGKIDLAHALFDEPPKAPARTTVFSWVTRWAARLTGDSEFRDLLSSELSEFVRRPAEPAPADRALAAPQRGGLISDEVRRDVPANLRESAPLRDLVARLEQALGTVYTWTDLQANRYAALHRRHVTRSTLFLVPIAVITGYLVQRCLNSHAIGDSSAAAFWRVALSVVELAAVLIIFDSYVVVREHRYHDRWLDYRSIAEKLRHILMLMPLGRPGIDAELPPTLGANDARSHWTNWYVRAVAREVGVFAGKLHDASYRAACHALLRHWLVRGQIKYHYFAAIRAHAPMHMLHRWRYWIFLFVVLSPVLDLFLEPVGDHVKAKHWVECGLELVFFCVPAVFASWYAFTRLADFENIELRSRAELQRLTLVDEELSAQPDQPSAELVRAAAMTSHAMLAELVEWRIAATQREPELGH
jgi:hypothetical protein